MGPSASAGTKVSARPAVPCRSAGSRRSRRASAWCRRSPGCASCGQRACNGEHRHDRPETAQPHGERQGDVVERVSAEIPANALPLCCRRRRRHRGSRKSHARRVGDPGPPCIHADCDRGAVSTMKGITRIAIELIFISKRLDLLAEVLGVRPIISPAMNTRRWRDEHGVQPGTHTAEHDLAQLHLEQRHQTARGVKESCMPLTAPQEVAVVMVANSAEAAVPKRVSLLPCCRRTGRRRRPDRRRAWQSPGYPVARCAA